MLITIFVIVYLIVWRKNPNKEAIQLFETKVQFSEDTNVDVQGTLYYKENKYLYMMLENCSDDSLVLGKYGTLYKNVNNVWEQVFFENGTVTMMAYTLESGKEMSISVPGGTKATLTEGRYRLAVEAQNEKRETIEIIAEFEID